MTRTTIRSLVGRVEAVALVVQAFAILSTINVDQLNSVGRTLLYSLGAVHVVAAGLTLRFGGPFLNGGIWPYCWLAAILFVPILMALLVPPGNYGVSPACPQLCGYSAPPVAIVAFYPWLGKSLSYLKPLPKACLISLTSIEPLLVELFFNGRVTRDNLQGLLAQTFIVVGVWAAGEAIGRICRRAAAAQVEVLRREYDRQFGYLHSDIETSLRLVEMHYRDGRPDLVAKVLKGLDETILYERIALTLAQDRSSVADIIRLHVRRFEEKLEILNVPRADVIPLPQREARILSETLGDLLKNALVHGAGTASIDLEIEDGTIRLQVTDNGPGFDAAVLDDPLTSLNRLKRKVGELGGTLMALPCDSGSAVRMTMPVYAHRRAAP